MGLVQVESSTQGGLKIWAYDLGFPGKKGSVLEKDPLFAMIYGERSNGKTFSGAELALYDYLVHGEKSIWLRKDDAAFDDAEIIKMFDPVFQEGIWVDDKNLLRHKGETDAKGKPLKLHNILLNCGWDGVEYKGGKQVGGWRLYRYDSTIDKNVYDDCAFCRSKPLRVSEAHKGGWFDKTHYVFFDEFLSRSITYMKDETILFANFVKTVTRYQKHARFIMFANTVNKRSEYFKLFNLRVNDIEQGTIYTIKNGHGDYLSVEYVEHKEGYVKPSDSYIDFMSGNRTKMMTTGSWEIADYPLLDEEIRPKDIVKQFFILLDEDCVKCQVVRGVSGYYIYASENDLAVDENSDMICSNLDDMRQNWTKNLFLDKRYKAISDLFKNSKILYDILDSGEIVNNYLKFCKSYSIIKA